MEPLISKDTIEKKIQAMKLKAQQTHTKNNNRVTQPFQTFALEIAEKLGDKKHVGIYMRLVKSRTRAHIDTALNFVIDSNAKSKPKLFMWKLKQLQQGKL